MKTIIATALTLAVALTVASASPAPKAGKNMSMVHKTEGSCKPGYCKQFSKRGNYLVCAPC